MPSISPGEIIIIVLAIVLFVKPEQLPRFMRSIGKMYAEVQRYIFKVRSYTSQTMDSISQLDATLTPADPPASGANEDAAAPPPDSAAAPTPDSDAAPTPDSAPAPTPEAGIDSTPSTPAESSES